MRKAVDLVTLGNKKISNVCVYMYVVNIYMCMWKPESSSTSSLP